MTVTVPVNTSAEVVIPAASAEAVHAGTVAAVAALGMKLASFSDGKATLIVGSGCYELTSRMLRSRVMK